MWLTSAYSFTLCKRVYCHLVELCSRPGERAGSIASDEVMKVGLPQVASSSGLNVFIPEVQTNPRYALTVLGRQMSFSPTMLLEAEFENWPLPGQSRSNL